MTHKTKNRKTGLIVVIALLLAVIPAGASYADSTFSAAWTQDSSGKWHLYQNFPNESKLVRNAWICDDAVAGNGQNVWYLIDHSGTMVSAGLVKDGTGNYYSLETNHNGYYGMLRFQTGDYNCNGQTIHLELESGHNGSFAAIKNNEAIEKLKAIYGLLDVSQINNSNCIYTSGAENKAAEVKTPGNDGTGWWVDAGNGRYQYYYSNGDAIARNEWIWSNYDCYGNEYYGEYYFGPDTYLMRNTTVPDGRRVGDNGAWINTALLSNPNLDKINQGTLIPANIVELQQKLNELRKEYSGPPSLGTRYSIKNEDRTTTGLWVDNDGSILAVLTTDDNNGEVLDYPFTATIPKDISGRYTVIPGPVVVEPADGLKGQYTLTAETYRKFILNSLGYYHMNRYNNAYVYQLNGEIFVMGWVRSGDSGPDGGEWLIDNTKPDNMYGKTNIRYRYPNGAFAGWGCHIGNCSAEYGQEHAQRFYSGNKNVGKPDTCFTEDGYLIRNSYVTFWPDVEGSGGTWMYGSDGGWLDRAMY